MSDIATDRIEELIDLLIDDGMHGMPVRVMEDLLVIGDAAVEPLIELLNEATVADDDVELLLPSMWAAVLLGELRAAAAATPLVDAILRSGRLDLHMSVASAKALATIGEPALPQLQKLAGSDAPHHRIWAYYAAGLMQAAAAHDFLLDALETDSELVNVAAMALGDRDVGAAIEPLHRALSRAQPWQRADIEEAIVQLHLGAGRDDDTPADWRLRYRLNMMSGRFPMSWAVIAALINDTADLRERDGPDVRPLDEILADARRQEPTRCDCCDVVTWNGTGVPVCPQTGASIAALQAHMLRMRGEQAEGADIFEALDDIERDLIDLSYEEEARGRRARERQDDLRTGLKLKQAGAIWAAARGAATTGEARAMLLAEGLRMAQEHGDPEGAFTRPDVPARAAKRVGRNDPCSCGSGRKYKKCCAARDTAGERAARRSAASRPWLGVGDDAGVGDAAPPAAPLRLLTFDNESVSFCRAHYSVTDEGAVLAALRARSDMDEVTEERGFNWFTPIGAEQSRGLGFIDMRAKGKLTLECMSRSRLDRGKELLQTIASAWLVHRSDTEQDPWQAIAERQRRDPVSEPRNEVPPEVAGPVIRQFLDRQYASWPDEALPALGGRTPRETVRTAEGRRQVTELLTSFDRAEEQRPEPLRYDFGWVWEELGLGRLR